MIKKKSRFLSWLSWIVRLLGRSGRIYHPKGGWGGNRRRILAPVENVSSYHLMSRTVGGDFLLSEAEDKEGLKKLMWKLADFLFVRVQTYCIMDNHFHILVQLSSLPKILKPVTQQEGEFIPEAEQVRDSAGKLITLIDLAPWEHRLIKHLSSFYSKQYVAKLTEEIKMMRALGQEKQIQLKCQAFSE